MVSLTNTAVVDGVYLRSPLVKVNVTLKTDLSKVPREHFQRLARMSDGAAYSSLEYNLQIEHGQSGLMKFSIEVDGKVYGAVDASY